MKRFVIALVLVLALVFSLTACGSGKKQPSSDKFSIYLITMDQIDGHWLKVDEGCKKAVSEIGADKIEYIFDAPEHKETNAQIEKINNAAAAGADLILLAASDPYATVNAIKAANTLGVEFLYVDSPADWDGALQTIATDNKAAGFMAGEEMLAGLAEAGITEGKIGIVNVNQATTSCVNREEGFREALDGKGFEILETHYCDGDQEKAKDLANAYIADGVVGIFGTNEGGTIGTGNAIKESGLNVIGVGFDTPDSVAVLVKEGALRCAMAQDPFNMGYLGIKAAYDYLANDVAPSPDFYNSGAVAMGKDDF